MKLSKFGKKFTEEAGILSLMQDMGKALADGRSDLIMMGGGSPGYIGEFQDIIQKKLQTIAADRESFQRLVGIYAPPQGEYGFIRSLANLLQKEYGWNVGPENICLTNGSQSAFFMLFNMFAGDYKDGTRRKICLPLAPEYIGYADIGITGEFFVSHRPRIEYLEKNQFKYRINFEELSVGDETGAICVSRPTNPTGNVVTDEEIQKLDVIAQQLRIPLIIDNAYGVPFPGIVFSDVHPIWSENIVLCLSLSKLGLPAVRTGIIIANKKVIDGIASMNAVMALAPGGFGAALAQEMIERGEIIDLSQRIIKPFYQQKAKKAVQYVKRELTGTPYRIHKPEGAMFLWLWFEGLPITSLELYERLKERGVLVISGHYFFPGMEKDSWKHKNECLRLTYSQDDDLVEKGIRIIGEEVKRAYNLK